MGLLAPPTQQLSRWRSAPLLQYWAVKGEDPGEGILEASMAGGGKSMEESVGSELEPGLGRGLKPVGSRPWWVCSVVTGEMAASPGDQGVPGPVVPGRMWLCIYRSSGSGVCCGLSSLSVWCHLVSLSCLFELVLSLQSVRACVALELMA